MVAPRPRRALHAAAALAGLPPAELVPAPVAAAAWLARDDDGDALALCDIGGSGCRVAIVTLGATPRLAASRELALGADLVEESVFVELLRMLGERDDDAAERLEALMMDVGGDELWRRCHAELARAARRAREELCWVDEAIVHVVAPVEQDLVLRREQVRALAERDLGPIAGALRELIAHASAEPRRCVLMGGAATTPGLAELLTAALLIPVEIAEAPQLVTALGAANGVSASHAGGEKRQTGAGAMALDILAEGVSPRPPARTVGRSSFANRRSSGSTPAAGSPPRRQCAAAPCHRARRRRRRARARGGAGDSVRPDARPARRPSAAARRRARGRRCLDPDRRRPSAAGHLRARARRRRGRPGRAADAAYGLAPRGPGGGAAGPRRRPWRRRSEPS